MAGQTWTAAGSPYCVTGDLFISNLTIEPGVTVLVDGPWRLNVQTIIDAQGTAEAPITFTAKDPAASKWKGMEFDQTVPGSVLRHCAFSHADDSAIRLIDSSATIEHCAFLDNFAPVGGGVHVEGDAAEVTLQQCLFDGNLADPAGGGVSVQGGGNATIVGGVFQDNHAQDGTFGHARGGAVYIDAGGGTVAMSNVIMGGNSLSVGSLGDRSGGGIYIASGDVTLTNVTIARNQRHGLHVAGGTVTVRNSILRENNGGGDQIAGVACVDFSIVQNGYAGGPCGLEIIEFNPAFAGPGTTLCDLTILDGSPAIDAGDPDPAYNDSTACSRPPFGGPRNDMGAHGGPGACWAVPTCPSRANLNGDCALDFFDFLTFQNLFAAGDLRADFDDSGTLDFFDFLAFQNAFAAGCP